MLIGTAIFYPLGLRDGTGQRDACNSLVCRLGSISVARNNLNQRRVHGSMKRYEKSQADFRGRRLEVPGSKREANLRFFPQQESGWSHI